MEGMPVRHKYSQYGGMYRNIVFDSRIKHKDYFNCKYLYTVCHEWFIEHNWATRTDSDWPETFYLHRFTQNSGEEIWIWWRFRKQFNKFIRYDLDMDWHIIGLENAEIIRNGKKYKANKGEPEIKLYAKLIFDPGLDFRKNKLMNSLLSTFYERIYWKDILQHRKQLYHEVNDFRQMLKTYFNLQKWPLETEGHKFWADENADTPFYDEAEKK